MKNLTEIELAYHSYPGTHIIMRLLAEITAGRGRLAQLSAAADGRHLFGFTGYLLCNDIGKFGAGACKSPDTVLGAANFGPPPSSPHAMAVTALALYAMLAIMAAWVERIATVSTDAKPAQTWT